MTVGRSTGGAFQWSGQWLTGDGQADLAWYESWNHAGITVGLAR